jgi:P-type Cu+ transporter
MDQFGVAVATRTAQAVELRSQGASVLRLAVDGPLAGLLAVSDPIKATTLDALTALRRSGSRILGMTPKAGISH